MNTPAPMPQEKRRHRPRTGMGAFITDQELYEYLGVPATTARPVITEMDRDPKTYGFPQKQPMWGNRRYLPAIEEWLRRRNGLKIPPSRRDEE